MRSGKQPNRGQKGNSGRVACKTGLSLGSRDSREASGPVAAVNQMHDTRDEKQWRKDLLPWQLPDIPARRTHGPGSGPFRWQDRNTGVDHLAFFAVVHAIRPMLPALPQCQAATPTQACLVVRPIRHPEFHLSDVMTTISVVFVRHGTRIKLIAILYAYRRTVQKLFMHQSHLLPERSDVDVNRLDPFAGRRFCYDRTDCVNHRATSTVHADRHRVGRYCRMHGKIDNVRSTNQYARPSNAQQLVPDGPKSGRQSHR